MLKIGKMIVPSLYSNNSSVLEEFYSPKTSESSLLFHIYSGHHFLSQFVSFELRRARVGVGRTVSLETAFPRVETPISS